MKRTELKRSTRLGRGQRRRVNRAAQARFREAARAQGLCAVTHTAGPWDPHHVIEKQELIRRGVDEWDPRNALRLLKPVHRRHTDAVKRVPLRALTSENIRFAFEVMGAAAHVYLHRMYAGEDPRVEGALAEHGVTPIQIHVPVRKSDHVLV